MKLTYEQTIDYLHTHQNELMRRYLKPAKKQGLTCPYCGSGQGENGTGISFNKKTNRYKCFACNKEGDIIDFMGGTESNADNLKRVCELVGIEIVRDTYQSKSQPKTTHIEPSIKPIKEKEAVKTDYSTFLRECETHLYETDYLTQRHIDEETAQRWGLGYCKEWKNPANPKAPTSPRLIIPTSQYSYVARYTGNDPKIPRYLKVGESNLLGAEYLKEYQEPVFIVEGELDAITLSQLGRASVGLGSAGNYKKLLEYIGRNGLKNEFIICLDNDDTGKRDTPLLKQGLDAMGIKSIVYNPYGECKDANETYIKLEATAFNEELDKAVEAMKAEADKERQEYLKTSAHYYIDDFLTQTDSLIDTPFTPTGFKELDRVLDGGLYEGLYIIGAISSLGKTTFVLQVADNIARSGKDVLIFSLEQSRFELVAKSMSRLTAERAKANRDMSLAKSLRDITTRQRLNKLNDEEISNLMEARNIYRDEISKHIFITEGMGEITAHDIRAGVEKHIRITGNKPIVIVDYLQILAPMDSKRNYTDKQTTDLSITEIKRICRDNKVSIIGISSFNRDNYTTGANMGAFKESGIIEYSSDVLLGLQLKGINEIKQNANAKNEANQFIENAKNKDEREIELKILKNRNGATGATLDFKYRPRFNYFEEVEREYNPFNGK